MKALHKKATGWSVLQDVPNQKPVEDLGVKSSDTNISEITSLHNYRIKPQQKSENTGMPILKNGMVHFPMGTSSKDIDAYYKKQFMTKISTTVQKCPQCNANCDGKHYHGDGSKWVEEPMYLDKEYGIWKYGGLDQENPFD